VEKDFPTSPKSNLCQKNRKGICFCLAGKKEVIVSGKRGKKIPAQAHATKRNRAELPDAGSLEKYNKRGGHQ